jgi:heme A synthase
MSLSLIHARLANSVFLYFLVMMVWALWRFLRKEGMNSNFRGALVVSEILILAQAMLGIILWFSSLRPERGGMHILYGIVGAIGVPAVYAFTKGRDDRKALLSYAIIYFCLLLIVLRSAVTG